MSLPRDPMAWAGLLLWAGALSWPCWRPPAAPLLLAIAALAALAALFPRARPSLLALGAGAFLLGAAAISTLPEPPELWEEQVVSGVVRSAQGREALVVGPDGRLLLRFPEPAPPPGTGVAARTLRAPPDLPLPGEPDRAQQIERARASPRRVLAWVPLGGPPAPPFRAERFEGARHEGLLLALATGARTEVSQALVERMERTGTLHLLAVSGLQVALLAGLAHALAVSLLRPLGLALHRPHLGYLLPALCAAAVGFGYAWMVGWPVSARRAAWMAGLAALSAALGRSPRAWTLLGLAAVAVVFEEPAQVLSAGFLLSFGAVAGMILVVPRLTRWLPPDLPAPLRWLAQSLATTLGATAGTLPVQAWLFQSLSWVSPLANLLAVPLIGGAATIGAIGVVLLPPPLDDLSLRFADLCVDIGLLGLELCDREPWSIAVGPGGAALLALAVLLRKQPLLAGALALLALWVPPGPRDRLRVTFPAVGQGDAALIRFPDGRRWLVDGGPPGRRLLQWLRREGVFSLDRVILSHPHPDHLGGLLPVLEELEVEELWVPRPPEEGELDYLLAWQAAWARGIALRQPGDPGLELLHPLDGWRSSGRDRVNEESLVFALQWGERRLLFTGDIERQAEAHLAGRIGRADLLKLPHHGSRSSSSPAFISAVSPALAVAACGADNRYGHPHAETAAHLAGVPLLRTDRDGTIEISTDGRDLMVRAWRPGEGWQEVKREAFEPQAP